MAAAAAAAAAVRLLPHGRQQGLAVGSNTSLLIQRAFVAGHAACSKLCTVAHLLIVYHLPHAFAACAALRQLYALHV
jgi:hypothetical protein